ncbi:MAG: hypothetical protein KU37_07795 [Sulfuricurvum sp. PC08-66]|nr:MAG: hypothetical protein KU37_07795 [Sulfuricurvum sp. PC08-66]
MRFFLFSMVMISTILASNAALVERVSGKTFEVKAQGAVGMSAVVMRTIGNYESIIASAQVVEAKEDTLTLKTTPFEALAQGALPSYEAPVAEGDTVYLGWMYERVLLIAPTVSSYTQLSSDTQKLFTHSDMFAAFLSKIGHPSPLKEDFQTFCRTYDLGLLQFAIAQKLYEVDCNTFAVVASHDIEEAKGEKMLPFYSRVQSIDANWWGEGSARIKEFERYYLELLGVSQ